MDSTPQMQTLAPRRVIMAALLASLGAAFVQMVAGALLAPDSRVGAMWHDTQWPEQQIYVWLFLAFFLFPIGLVAAVVLPPKTRAAWRTTLSNGKGNALWTVLILALIVLMAGAAMRFTEDIVAMAAAWVALAVLVLIGSAVRWQGLAVVLLVLALPSAWWLHGRQAARYTRMVTPSPTVVWVDSANDTAWVSEGANVKPLHDPVTVIFTRWGDGALLANGSQLMAVTPTGNRAIPISGVRLEDWVITDITPLSTQVLLRLVRSDGEAEQVIYVDPKSGQADLVPNVTEVRGAEDADTFAIRYENPTTRRNMIGLVTGSGEMAKPAILNAQSVRAWDFDPHSSLLCVTDAYKVSLLKPNGQVVAAFWPGRRVAQVRLVPELKQVWVAEGWYAGSKEPPWRLLAYSYQGKLLGTVGYVGEAVRRNMLPADEAFVKLLQ